MTPGSIALIAALVVLLALSAFFSASETAYSSLNRIRLKSLAEDGNPRAMRALALTERYDELLSSVLVGNNLVNILSTALATSLFVGFWGNIGVTISTVVMTVAVLLFGEISPKTLAKESPEKFAMSVAAPLGVIITVLTPVNWFFSAWKRLIVKIFKVDTERGSTQQELLTYVGEVAREGGINEREEEMIRTVIEFDDLDAGEIYTPRVDVVAFEEKDEPAKIAGLFHETGYSRLPVYRDNLDDIIGVVLEKDFSYTVVQHNGFVADTVRPVLFVTKQVKLGALLRELQQKKTHMAVIVDEYGGTMGIVTIEDIMEELVGEIWDEHDEVVSDIEPQPDGGYLVRGGTPLDDFCELFGLDCHATSLTVGGWVTEYLGRLAQPGESFEFEGVRVTVAETLRRRVVAVRAARVEEAQKPADEKPPEGEEK